MTWTVLAPRDGPNARRDPNNASLVLMAELRGVRILLTGDIELDAQRALLRGGADLRADVLKVPHHGSAAQVPALFEQVDARFATFSAGAGNTYGHPSPEALELARSNAMAVLRTDHSGDIALVLDEKGLRAVAR